MENAQITRLYPSLRKASEGGRNTCLTVNIAGDSSKWLQVAGNTINAAYPHSGETGPEKILQNHRSNLSLKLLAWSTNKFVTFEWKNGDITNIAGFIDWYFVHILGCNPNGYAIHTEIQEL